MNALLNNPTRKLEPGILMIYGNTVETRLQWSVLTVWAVFWSNLGVQYI